MHPTKSPGPDGFNAGFFQHHWEIVGGVVLGMVKSFFCSRRMLQDLNHTNIVLIPKIENPMKMSQFRPISLCNVVYKLISKVLTNRLKRVLPKVISQNQSAFVDGRQINDNVLVVHELLHSMQHKNEEDVYYMAMKLDMAKAYDRVEWSFLITMMHKLGFDDVFCQWVMEWCKLCHIVWLLMVRLWDISHLVEGLNKGIRYHCFYSSYVQRVFHHYFIMRSG
ncbi:hypothetical protein EV1_009536 [Malus domestica]